MSNYFRMTLEAIVNDHGAVLITMNIGLHVHEKVVMHIVSLYKGTEKQRKNNLHIAVYSFRNAKKSII